MTTSHQIPLFDIPSQHAPFKGELHRAVLDVLDSCNFILGKEGELFEKEFAAAMGSSYAVGVSSGTSALHAALQALDVGRGDGVLTAPFTFIGTTIGAAALGADIQFADIDPATYTLDPVDAKKRIKKNTKVIIPIHLYGQPADMAPIMDLAKNKSLRVVEDCAQSHLGRISREESWQLRRHRLLQFLRLKKFRRHRRRGRLRYTGSRIGGEAACASQQRIRSQKSVQPYS